MPSGGKRLFWNLLMATAAAVAGFASAWGLIGKTMGEFPIGNVALGALGVLLVWGVVGFVGRQTVR